MHLFDYTETTTPLCISLGRTCVVKQFLRQHRFGPNEKMPFDFYYTTHEFVVDSLRTDFAVWKDPAAFFVPVVVRNMLDDAVPRLCVDGYPQTIFTHEVTLEDFVKASDIETYLQPHEVLRTRTFSPDDGISLKVGVIDQLIVRNQEKIDAFYALLNGLKSETFQKPNLVFVRNEPMDGFKTQQDIAQNMFDTLQEVCGVTPFVFLYIQDVRLDISTTISLTPEVLFENGASRCIRFYNVTDGDHRAPLFELLTSIFTPHPAC
jgi:hypothetical protein